MLTFWYRPNKTLHKLVKHGFKAKIIKNSTISIHCIWSHDSELCITNPFFKILHLADGKHQKQKKWQHYIKYTTGYMRKLINNTSDNRSSQKRGWSISNVNMPGEGSDMMLLKLSSVLSLIAFRNDGTKVAPGCIVYNSLCKGCKHIKAKKIEPPLLCRTIWE